MQLELNPSNSHLRRILLIRLIMVVCQLVMMWFLRHSTAAQLHLYLAGGVLFLLSTYSAYTLWTLTGTVSENKLFSQLVVDVLALSCWLYFLGGANNPFVSYFLVPICISAALLPARFTWSLCSLAVLAYSLLYFVNQPLTNMSHDMHSAHEMTQSNSHQGFQLHILGMWANFLISAVLISYFISRMAITVRQQQQKLNALREQQLQNEQLMAIASLAAGTAHELGTPLNTMLLLSEQLESQLGNNPDSVKNLQRMTEQIKRCQQLLQKLVNTARSSKNLEQGTCKSIDAYLKDLLDQWQLLRPQVSYQLNANSDMTAPEIIINSQLSQAILNLLNNAADANEKDIQVSYSWDKYQWHLQIEDFGQGIAPDLIEKAGNSVMETSSGLGIGLLISNSTIKRLGGELTIKNKAITNPSAKGTIVTITIPLQNPG